eukprot:1178698-Prorocentrum_minimum.AAC.6
MDSQAQGLEADLEVTKYVGRTPHHEVVKAAKVLLQYADLWVLGGDDWIRSAVGPDDLTSGGMVMMRRPPGPSSAAPTNQIPPQH